MCKKMRYWESVEDRWVPLAIATLLVVIEYRTRRMAIANGTCVSFCNQLKAHFGLPWVRPWDIRGKCYMDGMSIQYWSNA